MDSSTKTQSKAGYRIALVDAVATLFLICVGAIVTSKGVGMSVPDWPNSYGYNMFLFPWNKWKEGGVFWEHSHRLVASGIGAITLVLAVWLWFRSESVLLQRLGVVAFFGVVVQGVLGGFRVVFDTHGLGTEFGVLHAALAQAFFSLLCVVVLLLSGFWSRMRSLQKTADGGSHQWFLLGLTLLVFVQLLVGAAMRHQHAGLAIPDFPLAYGAVWPDTSASAVASYNANRISLVALADITPGQIVLQMVHRILACGILFGAVLGWIRARRIFGESHTLTRFALFWLCVVAVQATLGAVTIWTGKAFEIATAHVAVGALSLMSSVLATVVSFELIQRRESGILASPSVAVAAGTSRQ